MAPKKMYVPQDISELQDFMAFMMLGAPRFVDKTGYFPYLNLDYVFRELDASLAINRGDLGEDRYQQLKGMADEMRPLFEADPDNKTGQAHQGCKIILAMEDILRQVKRKA
jgi:hypothetical protein